MDAQTELERALTLIDDLAMLLENYCPYDSKSTIAEKAEDFLRKHKRIP